MDTSAHIQRWVQERWAQDQRPRRTESTASAAAPAVEGRSTGAPRRTVRAPTAAKASNSSDAIPPPGPTTTTTSRSPPSSPTTSRPGPSSWGTKPSPPRPHEGGRPIAAPGDHRPPRPGRPSRHVGRRCQRRHDRQPRAAALLGRLTCGPAPFSERAVAPRAQPLDDRPRRGPRDDLVRAEFGEQFDRKLGALALRQRLYHHDPRLRRRNRTSLLNAQPQPVRCHGAHPAGQQCPPTVRDEDWLADAEPLDPGSVPSLISVELYFVPVRQLLDEEQRRRHGRVSPRSVGRRSPRPIVAALLPSLTA